MTKHVNTVFHDYECSTFTLKLDQFDDSISNDSDKEMFPIRLVIVIAHV